MNWNILNNTKPTSTDKIIEILLNNRGIKTKNEISEFLNPIKPENFTAKDLGIDEKELKKATDRIKKAIDKNEGIVVYGDYDADGICATAILWESIYELSEKNKNILPYIPERVTEGYGLSKKGIENCKLKIENLKLIITVDHGITASEKIKYAKELGIDVIVCDHHQIGKELPECEAIIHTEKICAAAISWFLSVSLRVALPRSNPQQDEIASSSASWRTPRNDKSPLAMTNDLDLVAIATIADLEPLIGVNRSFAKYGLEKLRKTSRCGLLAIFEEAGLKKEELDTYHIGYIIAPRINAMGRMQHALESLRLLCTKSCNQAKDLASKLGLTNKERQQLTEETVKQAKLLVAGMEGELPKFLVIDSDQYEEGIIGLVAGKLVEEYYRPALVISRGEVYSKASARSISGFNIIEAIRLQSDLIMEAGGHPMAAGLTIETAKIDDLRKRLILEADKIPDELFKKSIKIDMEIEPELINKKLVDEIQKMSPFGIGNPEPTFAGKMIVKDFRTVGTEGKHLKLLLSPSTQLLSPNTQHLLPNVSGIAFNQGKYLSNLKTGQEVEIAYNLMINNWNGDEKIEFKIKDLKCRESTN